MGKTTIVINGAQDWAIAAIAIKEYAKNFEKKMDSAIKRIAGTGEVNAIGNYAMNPENTDVRVTVVNNGRCNKSVVASGSQVFFNEFGAGAHTDTGNHYASAAGSVVPIYKGSYSDSVNGPYARHNYQYWYHNGVRYEGIQSSRAMYKAGQLMKQKAQQIIMSEFS